MDKFRQGITLDASRRLAFWRGRKIRLGAVECAALQLLLDAAGRPVTAASLVEQIWGTSESAEKAREVIRRLRVKLREHNLIETIGREGYRIVPGG